MKMMLSAALAVAMTTAAFGQDKPAGQLTVLEALTVGQALRQLGDHPDIAGKKVAVPFRFGGPTLMTMALNIAASEQIQKNYQTTYNALVRQFADGGDSVPPERMKEFTAESEKAMNAPSGYTFGRIKEADLCLEVKPQTACTMANPIPPALLSALIPIIDR